MAKRIIIILILLGGVFLVARAQNTPDELQPEREIYTVLAYGDDVFEPDIWYASAAEEPTRTTATWRADGIGGVGYADYLHFDEGIRVSQYDAVFDSHWFDVSLSNYAVWRENGRCDLGDLRLIDFSLQTNDIKYHMRYWIQLADDHRVLTLFVVFPAEDKLNLDAYADKLFPELPSCSGSVG
jgi:hypothetical protein